MAPLGEISVAVPSPTSKVSGELSGPLPPLFKAEIFQVCVPNARAPIVVEHTVGEQTAEDRKVAGGLESTVISYDVAPAVGVQRYWGLVVMTRTVGEMGVVAAGGAVKEEGFPQGLGPIAERACTYHWCWPPDKVTGDTNEQNPPVQESWASV